MTNLLLIILILVIGVVAVGGVVLALMAMWAAGND